MSRNKTPLQSISFKTGTQENGFKTLGNPKRNKYAGLMIQLLSRLVTYPMSFIIDLIVEGIFALHYMQLRKLYTLNVFIETSEDIRFQRRLSRDTKERGRTIGSIKDQFESTVIPMHEKFIGPSKQFADLT